MLLSGAGEAGWGIITKPFCVAKNLQFAKQTLYLYTQIYLEVN